MATSGIDASVFMRWQLPGDFDAPPPKERQLQLRQEFKQKFGDQPAAATVEPAVSKPQPKQQQLEPKKQQQQHRKQLHVDLKNQQPSGGPSPQLQAAAEQLLASSSAAERRVVQNALRLTEPRCAGDSDEVERRVKIWSRGAAPEQRRMAAEFFEKLAASLGDNAQLAAKAKAVTAALAKIQRLESKAGQQQRAAGAAGTSELKHLRLLSPGTRAARWQHTTWHHMPAHPDTSRGSNRNSHFCASGQRPDSHFRIHPDWGWDGPKQQ